MAKELISFSDGCILQKGVVRPSGKKLLFVFYYTRYRGWFIHLKEKKDGEVIDLGKKRFRQKQEAIDVLRKLQGKRPKNRKIHSRRSKKSRDAG